MCRHLNVTCRLTLLGLFFLSLTSIVRAVPAYSAHTRQQNWTTFAQSQEDADLTILRVDRLWQTFASALALESSKIPIPLTIVMDSLNDNGFKNGEVRVFPSDVHGYKIQVTWTKFPVPEEEFNFSMLRAFTLRVGLDSVPRNMRDKVIVSVPNWIPEGLSIMFSENDVIQEYQGWGTLIARFEPMLSIDELLTEFETSSSLDPSERAIAAVLCNALLKSPDTRRKLLNNIVRTPNVSNREWLSNITGKKGVLLDEWWNLVWRDEATFFPAIRLGFGVSRNWVLDYEKTLQSNLEPGSSFLQFSILLHPWFDRWVTRQKGLEGNEVRWKDSESDRTDIQLRRNLCLEWFKSYESVWQKRDFQSWYSSEFNQQEIPSALTWFDQFDNPKSFR